MTEWQGLPKKNEIEISLFGPGYGESVVLHIGNGKWIIIDSCKYASLPEPTPLQYLIDLNVDVQKDVILVIASHWHDDHIGGLSRILEKCAAAQFVCASAMIGKDFIMLGKALSKSFLTETGVKEFGKIHNLLAGKRRIMYASKNRTLLHNEKEFPYEVGLYSLSPSDQTTECCNKQLSSFLTNRGARRRIPSPTPNHLAVVLQLIIGKESILFGSDLENHSQHGWEIIVNDKDRSQIKSSVYKIAHHGAESGHNDGVWKLMLEESPYAFLTPFNKNDKIPNQKDVLRIKRLTPNAYITADPDAKATKQKYSGTIERTLRERGIELRPVFTSRGHIRYRFIPLKYSSRNVCLGHGAREL